MRETILELVCEVGDILRQSKLTIHLAVEYMDRIILLRNHFAGLMTKMGDVEFMDCLFEGHSIDTVALTCVLLASKF